MPKFQMRIAAFLLLHALVWAGCATDKVARDLADYVNQGVLNVAELERVALERYAAVTGPNYTTDRRIYQALSDDVVPLYKRFLDGLRRLRPETDEVRRLHSIYILGAEALHEGFKEKMYGIEKGDENIIRSANQKIEKGRVENERWRKELIELAQKHGLADQPKK